MGVTAARDKFMKWGEVWAEEEDLPSSQPSKALPSANNGEIQLSAQLKKDVSAAMQREQKLKVAKRKSKFY